MYMVEHVSTIAVSEVNMKFNKCSGDTNRNFKAGLMFLNECLYSKFNWWLGVEWSNINRRVSKIRSQRTMNGAKWHKAHKIQLAKRMRMINLELNSQRQNSKIFAFEKIQT